MIGLEELAHKFEKAKRDGGGWKVRCPCHDDKEPSLSISYGKDGRILLCCHAGCETERILDAVGVPMRDLYPDKAGATISVSRGSTGSGNSEAIYYYSNGTRKLRYPGKRFCWQHFEGGEWKNGRGNASPVPFRQGKESGNRGAPHPALPRS